MATPNYIPGMKMKGTKRKGKSQSRDKKDSKEWQEHYCKKKKLSRERKQKYNANRPYEL